MLLMTHAHSPAGPASSTLQASDVPSLCAPTKPGKSQGESTQMFRSASVSPAMIFDWPHPSHSTTKAQPAPALARLTVANPRESTDLIFLMTLNGVMQRRHPLWSVP